MVSSRSDATAAPVVPTALPQAWRLEVFRVPGQADPRGRAIEGLAAELQLEGRLDGVRFGRGFLLPPELSRAAVDEIVANVLCDPVVDQVRLTAPGDAPEVPTGVRRVLAAVLPGVMDPVARSLGRLLHRTGRAEHDQIGRVQSFRVHELSGELTPGDLRQLGQRLLANETIEELHFDSEGLGYAQPGGDAERGPVVVPLLELDDEALLELSRSGQLSLTLIEMRAVQAHYAELGREPLAAELETVAQTWSEHCKHKTLCGIIEVERPDGSKYTIDNLLKSTIAAATHALDRDFCLSVFVDNAGIVRFEDEWAVCFKVETHNHPSAIDPYGGAGTGIGGVIRDILGAGLGAKPIANTNAFFVGPTDLESAALPKGSLHPRRVLRGVVAGVRDYGNRMGIPTVSGGVWFDEGYVGNPLVYAGTVGLIPASMAQKEVRPGDSIVALGGRTGRDGIHGATFSSIELSEHSETESSHAVQIGDPITEKGVLDVLLAARDAGLYRGVTDCGAGGFSSAVGEMAEGTGAEVWLERVPLKYPGLTSHEVWISEAQERMVLSVPPEKLEALLELCSAEDVEAVEIGRFNDSGRLVLKDGGETVGDMDLEFLHDGTPRPTRRARWTPPDLADPGCPAADDPGAAIVALLGAPNVASREWIIRQYDHEVQAGSVLKPLVGERSDAPGDGAVIQPLRHSRRGLSITCGANPLYGRLDPYAMALAGIDEALRNAVAVGADPDQAAILDNFSWGNCDRPEPLGALVLAAEACQDAAMAYRTPFISGKDSLNNEYRVGDQVHSIPHTLLISCMAQVPDVGRAISMDAKQAGNAIYQVGATGPELGGSHWHRELGLDGGRVPRPDLETAPALLRALHAAAAAGQLRACHDLSEGGLGVAAAEMAFGGDLGLELDLTAIPLGELPRGYDPTTVALFSESCTRFLVEVQPDACDAFEQHLAGHAIARIGRVIEGQELRLTLPDGRTSAVPLADLRRSHQSGFQS